MPGVSVPSVSTPAAAAASSVGAPGFMIPQLSAGQPPSIAAATLQSQ